MKSLSKLVAAALVAALSSPAGLPLVGPAFAQAQPAPEQAPLKQSALTEAQVQAYIAAAKDMAPILEKLEQSQSEKPDPKLVAQLEAAAKKNKFASYADFANVGGNIELVMDGVDPDSKKYVGADTMIKRQIAEVEADKTMSDKDRKSALAALNDDLKAIVPINFPGNIDLVLKYYDQLVAAAPQPKEQ